MIFRGFEDGQTRAEQETEGKRGEMAAAAAGFWSHHPAGHAAIGPSLQSAGARPMAGPAGGGTGSSGSSAASSAGISANDFLTLLVTEMQNQDPTADTDPNEYINQLVQVNSLEQLIDINQNLSAALGGPSSTPSVSSASTQAVTAAAGLGGGNSTGAPSVVQPAARTDSALGRIQSSAAAASQSSQHGKAPGNLSVPETSAAAHRVAHSLGGRHHTL
jgi:flagellar basal-body rod modification protein FlgD